MKGFSFEHKSYSIIQTAPWIMKLHGAYVNRKLELDVGWHLRDRETIILSSRGSDACPNSPQEAPHLKPSPQGNQLVGHAAEGV